MPRYEYRCDATGEVVEVTHPMGEKLRTWGEVCDRVGRSPGVIPAATPVEKVISVGFVAGTTSPRNNPSGGSCGHGCGCHPH